jgi:hypothetical protein
VNDAPASAPVESKSPAAPAQPESASSPAAESESKSEQKSAQKSEPKTQSESKDESDDSIDDNEEYTSVRRTIFRSHNGLVHSIVEEQNGKSGEIKITEERHLGDRSMTLQRVLKSDGSVSQEFETHKNIGDDEESLRQFKDEWVKFAPTKNRALKF